MGIKKETEESFMDTLAAIAQARGWRVAHFCPAVLPRRMKGRKPSANWVTPVKYNGAGFPDLVMVRGDCVIYAELKMPGKAPTPEQVTWLNKLRWAGCHVYVWRSDDWPEIDQVLSSGPHQLPRTVLPGPPAPKSADWRETEF